MATFAKGVVFEGVDFDDPNSWRLEEYVKRGGYAGLRRIADEKTDARPDHRRNETVGAAWSRWCRFPYRPEMVVHAA